MKKIISIILAWALTLGGVSMSLAAESQDDIPEEKADVRVVPNYISSEWISGAIFVGTATLMIVAISASSDSTTTPSQHTPATHH